MAVLDHLKGTMRLHQKLSERDYQPEWRGLRDRCHQYYDGNQLEPAIIEMLKERNLPILITNLMQPAINGVLGMEARSRTDWFVRADDDEFTDIADALNVRVNEGLRTAKANGACSDAYKYQVVGGIGWVEAKKNKDPLSSKYSIGMIHPDEISWDFRSKSDLSNCNWMLRERWVDKEEAEAAFPKHKDIIKHSIGQWSSFDTEEIARKGELLSQGYSEYQYSTRDEKEWLLPHRDMVKVYELYYRVWEAGIVLRSQDGKAAVFNENNPAHVALINSGRVKIERRSIPSLRLSWYIGPHFITDMKSPHPHNYYPYIPFFGSREDKTNVPFGLARSMLSPQDEINFRRIRLTGDLNYKRIVMDDDATAMSDTDLLANVHKANGIVKLSATGKREGGALFKVESDQGISQQQFQIMQDAKMLIQDVAGIYNAFLGKEGGAQSGVAINSLVEQGATTLADINDNYHFARQMIGELVLAHEVEDMRDERNVSVAIPKSRGKQAREIILNQEDENGEVTNAIAQAKTQVVLGEIQQSAGYRAQQSQMLMDFISKLPAEFQAAGLGLVIEQLDISEDKRKELEKLVQKVTGEIDPEEMTDEQRAQAEKDQQKQAMVEELQFNEMQLAIEKLTAEIGKIKSDSQYTSERANTEQVKQAEMTMGMQREAATPPPPPDEWEAA